MNTSRMKLIIVVHRFLSAEHIELVEAILHVTFNVLHFPFCRALTGGDYDKVAALYAVFRINLTVCFAYHAFRTVTTDCSSDLFRSGYAYTVDCLFKRILFFQERRMSIAQDIYGYGIRDGSFPFGIILA